MDERMDERGQRKDEEDEERCRDESRGVIKETGMTAFMYLSGIWYLALRTLIRPVRLSVSRG